MLTLQNDKSDLAARFVVIEAARQLSLTDPENQFLRAALWYAGARGWRVFPCEPGAKTPMIRDWPNKATADTVQILRWWSQWPNANIGIATGQGLEVLDVDYSAGGDKSMRQLRESGSFPTTPTVETARGCHHYFKGEGNRNRVAILPGLDWRGEGGFVIAPPSIHPTGAVYKWSIKP
jgi:hypothetical protein